MGPPELARCVLHYFRRVFAGLIFICVFEINIKYTGCPVTFPKAVATVGKAWEACCEWNHPGQVSITEGDTKKKEHKEGLGVRYALLWYRGASHCPSLHRLDIKVAIRQRKTKEGHAQLRTRVP